MGRREFETRGFDSADQQYYAGRRNSGAGAPWEMQVEVFGMTFMSEFNTMLIKTHR
jgi:hypothetical protein